MSEERSKGHSVLAFFIGTTLGVAGTVVATLYMPDTPWTGQRVEGTVLDKKREPERLLLRVSTDNGVVLATFSERLNDLDLLIDSGDVLTLKLREVGPFVEDPPIERVMPSGKEPRPLPTGDQRAARIRELQRELEAWEGEIESFRARFGSAQGELGASAKETLARLQRRARTARERLEGLRSASADAWVELEAGLGQAWSELETALEEAGQKFNSPKEPPDKPQEEKGAPSSP